MVKWRYFLTKNSNFIKKYISERILHLFMKEIEMIRENNLDYYNLKKELDNSKINIYVAD